eukprot:m.230289 g.230289  ORF g.230289 m.230289 type:complete len:1075 (+) comp15998_c0_seq7:76-3300(+)
MRRGGSTTGMSSQMLIGPAGRPVSPMLPPNAQQQAALAMLPSFRVPFFFRKTKCMMVLVGLTCAVLGAMVVTTFQAMHESHHRIRRIAPELLRPHDRDFNSDVSIAGVWPEPSSEISVRWKSDGIVSVPPLVHQIWDDDIVETTCQVSAQSWERFCVQYGCRYMLWRRSDILALDNFVNREYYLKTEMPQMRADIVRYEILNNMGGLYLDCDMIWAGHSQASDAFVTMLNNAQLAVAASNDIRNATGNANLSLAVVFFTNRVIASSPRHQVISRTIQLASQGLRESFSPETEAPEEQEDDEQQGKKKQKPKRHKRAKKGPFHITGPYVLNVALQEVGDSTPVQVIPGKWVYPETLSHRTELVMFGHKKDRSVHKNGVALSSTGWSHKPWLMHRAMPNFFTLAQAPGSRFKSSEYIVRPGEKDSAIAVFLHHNKAGGTGVKVALQQLINTTEGLTHVDVFSKSACAYSADAIRRHMLKETPEFCSSQEWKEAGLPACGRCKAPATLPMHEMVQDSFDQGPSGERGPQATAICKKLKDEGRCTDPLMKGKCCKTCNIESCPLTGGIEVTPAGHWGLNATKRCQKWKREGRCSDEKLHGYCCLSCGEESCGPPSLVVGDYSMGICNVYPAGKPCAYYTMLREPRARIASSYLHCQYEPDDQLCMSHVLDARHSTFEQWVKHQGNYLMRQLMFDVAQAMSIEEQYTMFIKYLQHKNNLEKLNRNGAWIRTDSELDLDEEIQDVDEETKILRKALSFKPNMMWLLEQQSGEEISQEDGETIVQSMEHLFAVIGIVERFDESLRMFEMVFGLGYPDAAEHKSKQQAQHQMHVHEGEDLNSRKTMQEALMQQFADNPELDMHIKWDLLLYQRALEIFQRQEIRLGQMEEEQREKPEEPESRDDSSTGEESQKSDESWALKLKYLLGMQNSSNEEEVVPVPQEEQLEEGINENQVFVEEEDTSPPEPIDAEHELALQLEMAAEKMRVEELASRVLTTSKPQHGVPKKVQRKQEDDNIEALAASLEAAALKTRKGTIHNLLSVKKGTQPTGGQFKQVNPGNSIQEQAMETINNANIKSESNAD